MTNNQFEQLTKKILKVEDKLVEINKEIKDLIQKERDAKDEELLLILNDERTKCERGTTAKRKR